MRDMGKKEEIRRMIQLDNQLVEQSHINRFRLFGRSEMKELQKILRPNERIIDAIYGFYHGGSGLLVATDSRIILIDKRPLYVNLEDVPYSHVERVELHSGMLQATFELKCGSGILHFKSMSDARLRQIKHYALARKQALAYESSDEYRPDFEAIVSPQPQIREKILKENLLHRRKPTKFYPLHHSVRLSSK